MSGRKFYIVLRVFSSSHKASWSKYNCPQVASVQRPAWETKLAVTSAENRAIGPKIADVDKTVAMTEAWGDSPAVEAPPRSAPNYGMGGPGGLPSRGYPAGPLPPSPAHEPASQHTASTARLLENGTQAGRRAPIPRGLSTYERERYGSIDYYEKYRARPAGSSFFENSRPLSIPPPPPPPSSSSLSRMRLAPSQSRSLWATALCASTSLGISVLLAGP